MDEEARIEAFWAIVEDAEERLGVKLGSTIADDGEPEVVAVILEDWEAPRMMH